MSHEVKVCSLRGSRVHFLVTLALQLLIQQLKFAIPLGMFQEKAFFLSSCTLEVSWQNKMKSSKSQPQIKPQIKPKSSLKSNSSRSLSAMSHDVTKLGLISTDELKEFLECPVCLRVPRSAPVYQCDRGHVVCNECHPKLSLCPMCRCPMGHTRSLISEKVKNEISVEEINEK